MSGGGGSQGHSHSLGIAGVESKNYLEDHLCVGERELECDKDTELPELPWTDTKDRCMACQQTTGCQNGKGPRGNG